MAKEVSGESYIPFLENVHNFPHLILLLETYCVVRVSYPTHGSKRKISKFLSQDGFFDGGESYVQRT